MILNLIPPHGVTKLVVREWPKCISLSLLEVAPHSRGCGIGTQVLDMIKIVAQGRGKPIFLQACADSDREQPKLNRFYKRNGFKLVRNAAIPFTFQWRPE